MGRETVRKLVKDEPGVVKIRMGRKQSNTTYSVPESVARRIHTRLLTAAHIIGPHASMLIQPLIQAISLGNTVDELATRVLYIHPALTEVVAQALLELPSLAG